jgi:H+/Cl- antiporter ClcA
MGCVICGLLAGALSALLTGAVYAAEDAFAKLPIHWMWWPAIGGLVIGLGGMIFPQALGVGYDTIGSPSGQRRHWPAAWHPAGEVHHLGGIAGIGNIGRRSGARC